MHAVTAIFPAAAPRKFEVTCSSCNLREMCLPAGLCAEDLERIENVVYARRRVKRGDSVFNAGSEFNAVYAIRSGFFKTSLLDREGREQVTGFFMGGRAPRHGRHRAAATTAPRSRWRTARSACCPTRSSRICRATSRRCSASCTRCWRARSCATTAS